MTYLRFDIFNISFSYQESNNNHTGSSNEDDKSSTKSSSSSSHSSRCSENSLASSGVGEQDRKGEDPAKAGRSGNGITSTEVCNRQEQDGRHKVEDRHEERYSKGGSDRERKDPHERRNSREHGQRDCRLVVSVLMQFPCLIFNSHCFFPF